jgi:hypothetical protein
MLIVQSSTVFSISTGALGTVSIVEYFIRFRRLWRQGSTCRVIGARRWYLDWFHWNLSVAWCAIMIELIVYVRTTSAQADAHLLPIFTAPKLLALRQPRTNDMYV